MIYTRSMTQLGHCYADELPAKGTIKLLDKCIKMADSYTQYRPFTKYECRKYTCLVERIGQ